MTISVFINTLNEAKRIRPCLESVKWADEIVVVDMHSDDDTLSIVRQYTDKIFMHERLGFCEPARQFAAGKTTGEWILNLDADEMVTAALRRELLRIAQEGQYDAVYLPRRNYFWGQEMGYSGCGPLQDRPLRFYKRNAVTFNGTIHAGIQLNQGARVLRIDNPQACLLHFSYDSLQAYGEKMDRYTTIEAKALYASGKDYTLKAALKDAWNEFYKRYWKKSDGRKDGTWGLIYCLWMAMYRINIYAKYLLMKTYQSAEVAPKIEKKYQGIIAATLDELSADRDGHARRH